MTKGDRLHKLATELWRKAMADQDYSYKPVALRIDIDGWRLLLYSKAAFADGSFDRFEHPDKMKWRGLVRIMVHEPVSTHALREVDAKEVAFECKMLCIEAHQPGEFGRRKYYDATPEDLARAMADEGEWA